MSESPASGEPRETPWRGEAPARVRGESLGAAAAQKHEELRLEIQNDLGEVARVNELASDLLERCGAGEQVVYATQLALEEVLTNVIRHGYTDGGRHEIALVLLVGEGRVELEVVDDGREFDPTTASEVELDLPLAERQAGGLGIHLLRAFVSEIRYERRGGRNSLRLRI